MKAGKHVYAEKPCAMNVEDLEAVMECSRKTGMEFHEMAGTALGQPYAAIRKIVLSGIIGEVVQVFAQKSYPYFSARPQDEAVDGGLICQNGIHAIRFIEHVACMKVEKVTAIETSRGNPVTGGLKMAASLLLQLEQGAIASVIANYLNPEGFGSWGNESLRIFGTKGFVEATDGGSKTRLIVGSEDLGSIDITEKADDFFDRFIDSLLSGRKMPFTVEEELHPTRIVIEAKNNVIEV
jgi:predicted dehydrogenase